MSKLSVEQIKTRSKFLAGTIAEELDNDEPSFDADTQQIIKFHGIYQQDDRDVRKERLRAGLDKDYRCMVRASLPGGTISAAQYLVMDELSDRVGNGTLRITTRQGIQYHFTRKGDVRELIRTLNEHLLTTLAGCGDVVRNVMACPAPTPERESAQLVADAKEIARQVKPQSDAYWQLWLDGEKAVSAVAPDEEATADDPEPMLGPTYLPRKFKIGFAWPGDNCVDVFTQDIGIVPHVTDGVVEAYTLVVGGGMGMTHNKASTYPRLADPLCSVTREELLQVVKAIITVQRDYGDREDRKFARMKYLVANWGVERFRAEVESRIGRTLAAPRELDWSQTTDHLGWQPQADGRFTLGVRVANGRIVDSGQVRMRSALRAVAEHHASEVRFTPNQDVLLVGIAADDHDAVEALLREHGVRSVEELPLVARHALACPALPTCGLALAEAERVAPAFIDDVQSRLEAAGLGEESVHLRITGCPNGCARPYATEIGFVGRGSDRYTIYLGGSREGTRINAEFADRVPGGELGKRLEPVFEAYRGERRDADETFGDWCHRHGVEALAERFTPVPVEVG